MNTKSFELALANGQQTVVIPGGCQSNQLIVLAAPAYPGAGTVTVESQMVGSSVWVPSYKGANLPFTGPLAIEAGGPAARFRVTFAGIVGGAGPVSMWVSDSTAQGFPPGAFVGLRALTTQPYTEANVKNGVQFYTRAVWPLGGTIAAGATAKIFFQTGAKQVLVKLREFQFVAEEIRLRLFRTPTGVAGGTALAIRNYNGVNPVATTVSASKNVTTVSDGVPFDDADPEYFFGASNAPQRNASSIPQGRERVLPANSTFLVRIDNTGTDAARCQYYLDWYEGGSDLPA